MTLGEAIGCPEDEAVPRFSLRQAMEHYGAYWANDLDVVADACEDQASNLPLSDQPRFAFLRGQATAYRRLAKEIRNMPAANAAVINLMNQQGDF